MKKRLFILLLIMILCSSTTSWGSPYTICDSFNMTTAYRYRNDMLLQVVSIKDPVTYNSNDCFNLLSKYDKKIENILFELNTAVGPLTIGYYVGGESLDFNQMRESIINELKYASTVVLEMYQNCSVEEFNIDNLTLSMIEVQFERENEASISSNDEQEIKSSNNETIITNAARATIAAINSSYHTNQIVNGHTNILWYNHINSHTSACVPTLALPHRGDGNQRYLSGYKWYPNNVQVRFYTGLSNNENRTELKFLYNTTNFGYLNYDSNEALEIEVVFYNYYDSPSLDKRGYAFQTIKSGASWSTNMPVSSCYLDTHLCDGHNEVSFCVGVDDVSTLSSGTWYYWSCNGGKGITANNYPNDGRFKVVAQRSYKYLLSGAYGVFSEEHEPILKLGISSNYNWVPAVNSAWVYALGSGYWAFSSSAGPVSY